MSGKKGRSGRKGLRSEIKVSEICKLSVRYVRDYLKNPEIDVDKKAHIATEIVKKYMPSKLGGEKADVQNYINVLQGLRTEDIRGIITRVRAKASADGPAGDTERRISLDKDEDAGCDSAEDELRSEETAEGDSGDAGEGTASSDSGLEGETAGD